MGRSQVRGLKGRGGAIVCSLGTPLGEADDISTYVTRKQGLGARPGERKKKHPSQGSQGEGRSYCVLARHPPRMS